MGVGGSNKVTGGGKRRRTGWCHKKKGCVTQRRGGEYNCTWNEVGIPGGPVKEGSRYVYKNRTVSGKKIVNRGSLEKG